MNMKKVSLELSNKQVEFLLKCIDITQSTQSIKPDLSEVKVIKKLEKLNDSLQDDKYGDDMIYYDIN